MADNLTHSWSNSITSSKSTSDVFRHGYSFSSINTSAVSKIPPYSKINSATLNATATKDPAGSLSIGDLTLYVANYTGSEFTDKVQFARKSSLSYKSSESISADILSYVKDRSANSGYVECSGSTHFLVEMSFVAVYKQGFTSTASITWNYNEPRAKVSVSKSGEGTVTGAGTYHYGKTYTITATPASGWKFVKWSDGNTSASRTFTVNKSLITAYETSKSYQAIFEVDKINKIYIGTSQPKAIYIGTQEVKAVYVGTTKVYG